MFDSLKLTNFKCYQDVSVPLKRLTILVGPNNAGKSTLLHSLLLLQQTIEKPTDATLITSGKEVDVGSGRDILNATSSSDTFSIHLELSSSAGDDKTGDNLLLSYKIKSDISTPYLLRSIVARKDREIIGITREDSSDWQLRGLDNNPLFQGANMSFMPSVVPRVHLAKRPSRSARSKKSEKNGSSNVTISPEDIEFYTAFSVFVAWQSTFRRLWHIQPVRQDIPQFAQSGKTFDTSPESGGEAFLISLGDRLPRNRTVIEAMNEWVSSHDFMISRLDLQTLDKGGRFLSLMATEKNCDQAINVANMGRGISQALPILARVLRATNNECGIIEQPELHLHPAAQGEMGDVIADYIIKHKKSQLIVETHSEHLIARIRRYVASGSISPQDVVLISVSREEGVSKAVPLYLDEYGNFANWPDGFFQEGYNEALAIAEVAMNRKATANKRKTTARR